MTNFNENICFLENPSVLMFKKVFLSCFKFFEPENIP